MISLFSLRFRTNTHLYPTCFTSSGVWTIGPKTSCFVDKCNSTYIASFHFGQSFLCRHSSTFRGLRSSSFLMISEVIFLLCVHNLLRSYNFSSTCASSRASHSICVSLKASCSICAFSRAFGIICASFRAIDLLILN